MLRHAHLLWAILTMKQMRGSYENHVRSFRTWLRLASSHMLLESMSSVMQHELGSAYEDWLRLLNESIHQLRQQRRRPLK